LRARFPGAVPRDAGDAGRLGLVGQLLTAAAGEDVDAVRIHDDLLPGRLNQAIGVPVAAGQMQISRV
jgi:hypothetical protein